MTKVELARHLREPHPVRDRTLSIMSHALPESELRCWTKDELEKAHRDLHPDGTAER